MRWKRIESEQAFEEILKRSFQTPVLLFKHSIRCSISSTALQRLERSWQLDDEMVEPYLIDVINERSLSNKIAFDFDVWHESPQALLIINNQCLYHKSHLGITYPDITKALGIEN